MVLDFGICGFKTVVLRHTSGTCGMTAVTGHVTFELHE